LKNKFIAFLMSLGLIATMFIASPAEAAAPRRTVTSHSGYGDWRSSLKNVKTDRALRVRMTVHCDRPSEFNFVLVSWNGKPTFDYDSNWTDLYQSRSKTIYLYPDVRRGYLEIGTQGHCWVSVKATQRR
jgi:hypothetical protein